MHDTGESACRRGVSRSGRRDLKPLLVEAAQCALRTGGGAMHKWARRKAAQGKHRNVAVCALARKLLTHVWHILMGHPAPADAEADAAFERKLMKVAHAIGREGLAALGHADAAGYIRAVCATLRPPGIPPPCGQRQGETPCPPFFIFTMNGSRKDFFQLFYVCT